MPTQDSIVPKLYHSILIKEEHLFGLELYSFLKCRVNFVYRSVYSRTRARADRGPNGPMRENSVDVDSSLRNLPI
jgi:hypothetical protein